MIDYINSHKCEISEYLASQGYEMYGDIFTGGYIILKDDIEIKKSQN